MAQALTSSWRVGGTIIGPVYMLPRRVVPPTTTERWHTGHSPLGVAGRDELDRVIVGPHSQDHARPMRLLRISL